MKHLTLFASVGACLLISAPGAALAHSASGYTPGVQSSHQSSSGANWWGGHDFRGLLHVIRHCPDGDGDADDVGDGDMDGDDGFHTDHHGGMHHDHGHHRGWGHGKECEEHPRSP